MLVSRSKTRRFISLLVLLVVFGACATKPRAPLIPGRVPEISVEWPAGTVLVSRNKDESQNTSPGFQNHLALYLGEGVIVESQINQGVVRVSFEKYKIRPYDWFPLFPIDAGVGQRAADKARTLVGIPYRKLSSLFPEERIEERGLNCVSVVRVSYVYALGKPLPKLKLPDDILKLDELFTRKWVYETR